MGKSALRTGLCFVGFLLVISDAVWAQCSGGQAGGSGRTGFNLPTTTAANYTVNPYTTVNSNGSPFQVAANSQRQQMEMMYNRMIYQQNQIAAMQQQLVMERAAQARATGQQMNAARKERAREKERQRAETLVSSKGKKST